MKFLDDQSARRILTRRSRAQGLVEYGLIIALVAVVAIAGLLTLGPTLSSMFSSTAAAIAPSPDPMQERQQQLKQEQQQVLQLQR